MKQKTVFLILLLALFVSVSAWAQSNKPISIGAIIQTTKSIHAGDDLTAGDDLLIGDDATIGGDVAATGTVTGSNISTTHSVVDSISSNAGALVVADSLSIDEILDVDTIKSISGGVVTVEDSLTVDHYLEVGGKISAKNPYIHLSFADSTATVACEQDSLEIITNAGGNLFAVEDSLGFTYIPGDTLQVDTTGHYLLIWNLSFSGNNGENWKIAVRTAVTDVLEGVSYRYTSNNDTGNVTVLAYLEATAGEKFTLEIMNLTDGDDAVMKSSAVHVQWNME